MPPFPRFIPLAAALITISAVLAGVFEIDHLEQERLAQQSRSRTLDQLSIIRGDIESALNARLFLGRGLVAYASTHPGITVPEFQLFAAALVRQQSGIRSIQLAKSNIVSHIYPLKGNEAALGLRLLEIPKQRDAVQRAIKSRSTIVAGPVDLVQGGRAFVSRTPVFLSPAGGEPGSGTYWGLATIILDMAPLFKEVELSQGLALRFALRGKDSTGADGETFWGDPGLFEKDSVRLDITLPNGSWQIAAMPEKRWANQNPAWLRQGGVLLALVAGMLVWFLARNPARLRRLVQQTTSALRESEKKYRDLVHDANSIILQVDERGEIIFINEYAQRFFGWDEAEILGQQVLGTIVPGDESPGRNLATMIEDVPQHQHPEGSSRSEHENIRKNGERVWISWSNRAIRDDQGRFAGFLCVGTDISERKKAETSLREAHTGLEIRVTERTAELRLSNDKLKSEITERKRAEDSRHNQLRLTQALFEAIPSPVFYKNRKGEYLGCNRAFETAFGLSRQKITGATVYDLMPKDLADIYYARDEALFLEPGLQIYESRVGLVDGTRRDVIFYKATFTDANGELSGLVGVILDITERKQMEEALRRAHDELEERVRERTQELTLTNEELSAEIKERKQAEEALRSSEARNRALLEAQPDMMFLLDAEGTFLDYHAPDIDKLLTPPENFVHRNLCDVMPPNTLAPLFDAMRKVLDSNELQLLEYQLPVPNGPRYFENRMVACEENKVICIVRDITERKQTEDKLRRQAQIIDQTHDSVITSDLDGIITFWNNGARQMFGYSAEETLGRHISMLDTQSQQHDNRHQAFLQLFDQGIYETKIMRRKKSGETVYIHLILTLLKDTNNENIGIVGYSMDITERKRLEQQIIEISEEEQKRIGQELHDGLGQHLTGVAFLGKALEQKLAARSLPEVADAAEIVNFLNQAITQTRVLARGLFPVELENNGLMSALEQLASGINKLFGIACIFRCINPILVHDRLTAINLYRIAQEAVANAAKHSKASNILIELAVDGDRTNLTITDNGTGLDPHREHQGMGLHIMQYRANMLGATLSIRGAVGGGTEVRVSLDQ
ncbi:MAG TPA: PAS domain S-box protein [Sulfuricella sp.]|nr:PAS domain S-box protein [Sulfuricella sp.]